MLNIIVVITQLTFILWIILGKKSVAPKGHKYYIVNRVIVFMNIPLLGYWFFSLLKQPLNDKNIVVYVITLIVSLCLVVLAWALIIIIERIKNRNKRR